MSLSLVCDSAVTGSCIVCK